MSLSWHDITTKGIGMSTDQTPDLADLFASTKKKRNGYTGLAATSHLIRLLGGSLDMQVKTIDRLKPEIVFTTDKGETLVYGKGATKAAYTEYWLLTEEQRQNNEFERGLLAAAGILSGEHVLMRWDAIGNSYQHKEALKDAGFRWDQDARIWYIEGTLSDGTGEKADKFRAHQGMSISKPYPVKDYEVNEF